MCNHFFILQKVAKTKPKNIKFMRCSYNTSKLSIIVALFLFLGASACDSAGPLQQSAEFASVESDAANRTANLATQDGSSLVVDIIRPSGETSTGGVSHGIATTLEAGVSNEAGSVSYTWYVKPIQADGSPSDNWNYVGTGRIKTYTFYNDNEEMRAARLKVEAESGGESAVDIGDVYVTPGGDPDDSGDICPPHVFQCY